MRESVGVNLHLEYDNTPYADPERTRRALGLIGLTHVRDAAMRTGPDREPRFAALARAGGRFDLFVNRDLPAQLASVTRLVTATPGSVDLIEGPNEANHEPFGDAAGGDAAAAQSYQQRLSEAARRNPELSHIPVASFTYWPPLSGRADWANFHAYPDLKRDAAPQLAWMRTMAAAVQPQGSPVVCTEAGYTTAGSVSATEAQQAALTLDLLLENFRAHVTRTYLYELFDEHADSDAAKPERENHFGLFRVDGAPKPAAVALARFLHLLDAAPGPGRPALPIRVHPSGRGLRTLEITRTDGTRLTFAWWADAQAVTRRPLRAKVSGGPEVQWSDPATGEAGALRAGETTLMSGPGPLVFVQPAAAIAAGRNDRS